MTFVVTSLTIMLLSTSYAWYQFDTAVTPFNDVETFSNGLDDLSVIFTNDNNISTNVGIPITAAQVPTLANKTNFSITPSESFLNGRDVAIQISLVNLDIDAALTNTSYLKYELLETLNGVTTSVASGNFYNLTEDNLLLKSMTEISVGSTYSYEFRLWLEESGGNQNALMGRSISGRIMVYTIAR